MLAFCVLAGLVSASPCAAQPIPAVQSYDRIVGFSIYPPLKPNGTADDALNTGQVKPSYFGMAERASKPWRIAFLFPHIKDPYWVGCDYGVMTEAKRLGIAADIYVADGYDDLKGQLRKMNELITEKYDAIVVSPIDLVANNPSIAKARAQGIPVFELANDSTSDDFNIKVTTSLRGMGEEAMRWIIRDAQKRGLKSINIGLLPGPQGAGWVTGEVEGTQAAAKKAPLDIHILAIKYGDSGRIPQSQLAEQLINAHGKKLDYILGCTGCAPAASARLKDAGLDKKIKVVAYDLTREIANLIKTGDIAASADTKAVSQARVVTSAVVNHLEKRTAQSPHTILIKLDMVDPANYAHYKFDTSIAPDDFVPVFSYNPAEDK
ncbi:protein TorT [Andreprevotia lacus DSM 23236]|uniref:Protein TorT n=1 Tax=Andreprevotia lacus DSM 23236 TaxID=1121001 RepID=A0A1W1XIB8_9NEIS|nr:protein TorT [Andreprevotia lacus DSM 23236]